MKFKVIQWFKSDPKNYNCLYARGWKRLNFPSSSTRDVSFIYYDPTLGTLENSYCNATRYSETWDLQQRRNISSRFCFISKNDTFYRALSQEICESSSSAKIFEKVYQVSIHQHILSFWISFPPNERFSIDAFHTINVQVGIQSLYSNYYHFLSTDTKKILLSIRGSFAL